ncbi:MAG: hypothetical protein LBB50_04720, partial [Oscillospiraceae bacterium]|nr:hypothetical protein [Oscillospiraceae bacterium]
FAGQGNFFAVILSYYKKKLTQNGGKSARRWALSVSVNTPYPTNFPACRRARRIFVSTGRFAVCPARFCKNTLAKPQPSPHR